MAWFRRKDKNIAELGKKIFPADCGQNALPVRKSSTSPNWIKIIRYADIVGTIFVCLQ